MPTFSQAWRHMVRTRRAVKCSSISRDEIERHRFIDWIAENPDVGDVIPGPQGLRKVRWTRAGMGKRGGARVLHFHRSTAGEIVLIVVYVKAQVRQPSAAVRLKLKERFDGKKT